MVNYGAVCGILSAFFFAIPAVRQEISRYEYEKYIEQKKLSTNISKNDKKLDDATEEYMIKSSIKWDKCNSYSILFGSFLLAISFVFELNTH
jgi:hypothetical protein